MFAPTALHALYAHNVFHPLSTCNVPIPVTYSKPLRHAQTTRKVAYRNSSSTRNLALKKPENPSSFPNSHNPPLQCVTSSSPQNLFYPPHHKGSTVEPFSCVAYRICITQPFLTWRVRVTCSNLYPSKILVCRRFGPDLLLLCELSGKSRFSHVA